MVKKYFSVVAVSLMLIGCLLGALPSGEVKEAPPIWEKIPEIVETVEMPEPTEPHELILHYDPIEPIYEVREFSYEDAQMLMRIAQAEAGNQGIEGMKIVMTVVLNRVADEAFPNTIEGVIFQDHQFQPVSNGEYYRVDISMDAHIALADIERGIPFDEDVVAFEVTSNSKSLEKYFTYAYTVGAHDFYIAKGGK
jgi:hypothetical protein